MKHRVSIGVLLTLLGIITIVPVLPAVGFCEVPQQINYQGRLTDAGGVPIDGNYAMSFSIYDVPAGGTALWGEGQTVAVDAGSWYYSTSPANVGSAKAQKTGFIQEIGPPCPSCIICNVRLLSFLPYNSGQNSLCRFLDRSNSRKFKIVGIDLATLENFLTETDKVLRTLTCTR